METEAGKLFIGGISWQTNEARLREYFQAFGDIIEVVVMRDRSTGRGRGFGFVVFANASVAERVVKEKHVIDGRSVEAKKAVPRDDNQNCNRSNGSIQGSPGPARTKKIFVGGLASTVTETDFRRYFERFGSITDVVVMYDHNTQRPRGFGFITYDSEEAVDKVLLKTFHELNGKMVEVKRAVPKEFSPGRTHSPSSEYNYGLNRPSSVFNSYTQGYLSNPLSSYGIKMDDIRHTPATVGRSGYPAYGSSNHGTGSNLDLGFDLNYGHGNNSYFSENSGRYGSLVSYGSGSGTNNFLSSSFNRNMCSNGNTNYSTDSLTSLDFVNSEFGNAGKVGSFGSVGEIWGNSSVAMKAGGGGSLTSGNIAYAREGGDNNIGSMIGQDRDDDKSNNVGSLIGYNGNGGCTSGTSSLSYAFIDSVGSRGFGNLNQADPLYDDHAWNMLPRDLECFKPSGYELGSEVADVLPNHPVGYAAERSVAAG